jgi:hypothetical protein
MWCSHLRASKYPTVEDWISTCFSRNVGNRLPIDAALYPTRTDTLATPLRKPKNSQKRRAYQLFALISDVIVPGRRETCVATVARSVPLIAGLRTAAVAEP